MSQQNRTTLKNYFRTGQRPTQEQFTDMIDSSLNLTDDGIFDDSANLGLGHNNPASKLSVNGNVTVSPNNDSAPDNGLFVHGNVGVGAGFTNPTAQLAVKGSVYIGNTETTDPGSNSLKVDGDIATEGNLSTGGNMSIAGTLHAMSNTTMDGNLTLANTKYVATDEVRARDNGGLKLYEADGANGLMIHDNGNVSIGWSGDGSHKLHVDGSLRVTIDTSIGGNLTLANNQHVATDEVRARDNGGLKLYEAGGANGLMIHDNGNVSIGWSGDGSHKLHVDGSLRVTSDTSIDGNLTLANTKYVATDEVRARDNGGLKLYEAGGANGLMIHDNGNVSIGWSGDGSHKLHVEGDTRINGELTTSGNIQAISLSLTGGEQKTSYHGISGDDLIETHDIKAPQNKVVVGLSFKRYTSLHPDRDFYRFALIYK